jgi:hypothetical protein
MARDRNPALISPVWSRARANVAAQRHSRGVSLSRSACVSRSSLLLPSRAWRCGASRAADFAPIEVVVFHKNSLVVSVGVADAGATCPRTASPRARVAGLRLYGACFRPLRALWGASGGGGVKLVARCRLSSTTRSFVTKSTYGSRRRNPLGRTDTLTIMNCRTQNKWKR